MAGVVVNLVLVYAEVLGCIEFEALG